jgi:hypothetical protein
MQIRDLIEELSKFDSRGAVTTDGGYEVVATQHYLAGVKLKLNVTPQTAGEIEDLGAEVENAEKQLGDIAEKLDCLSTEIAAGKLTNEQIAERIKELIP